MKNLSVLFIALLLIQLTGCMNESERDVSEENNSSQDDNLFRDITIDDVVNVPPNFQIQYEIIKIEDLSYSGVDRRLGKISVPSGLSKKGLTQNIYHSIKAIYNTYYSDGISIWIYVREKDGQIGNYLGKAEFAPNGDWNKVNSNMPLEEYLVRLDIQYWYYKSEGKTSQKIKLPSPVESDNPYLKKYAGGYTIEVKGISSANEFEAYVLSDNGEAKWMWIENDGRGRANIKSKKTGTWTATETKISTKIQGNTGLITEDYVLQNGIFVNTLLKDRYLKPNK